MTTPEKLEVWAVVELMGHVKVAGLVTEEERFGCKMGRIDIPMKEGGLTTQYFGGSSVYRMTPTTEEVARAIATKNQPAPIHSWELPQAQLPGTTEHISRPPYEEDLDGGRDDDRDDY